MSMQHDRVHFGAAHYHEYLAPARRPTPGDLKRDLDLMAAAGFPASIATSASRSDHLEPSDGRRRRPRLARAVLDGAHERSIDVVVLGTPTPPCRRGFGLALHPEIAGSSRRAGR